MSANDPLPWLQAEVELIRHAVREDVPVIGHCLGGQMLAMALGGQVTRNAVPEIGWSGIRPANPGVAAEWLGEQPELTVFQWHSETFSIPPGATRIAANEACANQAFVAGGKHLGMQFHIEMTRALVDNWVETTASEIEAACGIASVQTAAQIAADLQARLAGLERLSGRIYAKWIQGLDGR
jgi:GMP synthase-like glutamine amidotransferase